MRHAFLLILTFALSGCVTLAVPQPARSGSPDEQIKALLPGADLSFDAFTATGSASLALRTFSYKSQGRRTPYGYGFGVVKSETRQLLWIHLIPGDYAPHHLGWADFDGDNREDLVLHFGEEEPVGTQVIFDRLAVDHFALTNFAVGVSVDDAYAVVVEDPRDHLPDLLVPLEPRPHVDFENQCLSVEGRKQLREIVSREFRRVSGRFSSLNIGGSEVSDTPDMFLFELVRFVNLREGWWNDVTQRHLEHLQWRVATLRAIRAEVGAECLGNVDRLISDLVKLGQQTSNESNSKECDFPPTHAAVTAFANARFSGM